VGDDILEKLISLSQEVKDISAWFLYNASGTNQYFDIPVNKNQEFKTYTDFSDELKYVDATCFSGIVSYNGSDCCDKIFDWLKSESRNGTSGLPVYIKKVDGSFNEVIPSRLIDDNNFNIDGTIFGTNLLYQDYKDKIFQRLDKYSKPYIINMAATGTNFTNVNADENLKKLLKFSDNFSTYISSIVSNSNKSFLRDQSVTTSSGTYSSIFDYYLDKKYKLENVDLHSTDTSHYDGLEDKSTIVTRTREIIEKLAQYQNKYILRQDLVDALGGTYSAAMGEVFSYAFTNNNGQYLYLKPEIALPNLNSKLSEKGFSSSYIQNFDKIWQNAKAADFKSMSSKITSLIGRGFEGATLYAALGFLSEKEQQIFYDMDSIDKFNKITYGSLNYLYDSSSRELININEKGAHDIGYYPAKIAKDRFASTVLSKNSRVVNDDLTGSQRSPSAADSNQLDKLYFEMIYNMQKMNTFYMAQLFSSPIEGIDGSFNPVDGSWDNVRLNYLTPLGDVRANTLSKKKFKASSDANDEYNINELLTNEKITLPVSEIRKLFSGITTNNFLDPIALENATDGTFKPYYYLNTATVLQDSSSHQPSSYLVGKLCSLFGLSSGDTTSGTGDILVSGTRLKANIKTLQDLIFDGSRASISNYTEMFNNIEYSIDGGTDYFPIFDFSTNNGTYMEFNINFNATSDVNFKIRMSQLNPVALQNHIPSQPDSNDDGTNDIPVFVAGLSESDWQTIVLDAFDSSYHLKSSQRFDDPGDITFPGQMRKYQLLDKLGVYKKGANPSAEKLNSFCVDFFGSGSAGNDDVLNFKQDLINNDSSLDSLLSKYFTKEIDGLYSDSSYKDTNMNSFKNTLYAYYAANKSKSIKQTMLSFATADEVFGALKTVGLVQDAGNGFYEFTDSMGTFFNNDASGFEQFCADMSADLTAGINSKVPKPGDTSVFDGTLKEAYWHPLYNKLKEFYVGMDFSGKSNDLFANITDYLAKASDYADMDMDSTEMDMKINQTKQIMEQSVAKDYESMRTFVVSLYKRMSTLDLGGTVHNSTVSTAYQDYLPLFGTNQDAFGLTYFNIDGSQNNTLQALIKSMGRSKTEADLKTAIFTNVTTGYSESDKGKVIATLKGMGFIQPSGTSYTAEKFLDLNNFPVITDGTSKLISITMQDKQTIISNFQQWYLSNLVNLVGTGMDNPYLQNVLGGTNNISLPVKEAIRNILADDDFISTLKTMSSIMDGSNVRFKTSNYFDINAYLQGDELNYSRFTGSNLKDTSSVNFYTYHSDTEDVDYDNLYKVDVALRKLINDKWAMGSYSFTGDSDYLSIINSIKDIKADIPSLSIDTMKTTLATSTDFQTYLSSVVDSNPQAESNYAADCLSLAGNYSSIAESIRKKYVSLNGAADNFVIDFSKENFAAALGKDWLKWLKISSDGTTQLDG
ncbi:MAG: hypothetical protein PHV30_11915, partial [Candidatus Margulisbacteria bacterium]|nr:hypothetical protein [Candidatus Margulisiibacteriota bacterium]